MVAAAQIDEQRELTERIDHGRERGQTDTDTRVAEPAPHNPVSGFPALRTRRGADACTEHPTPQVQTPAVASAQEQSAAVTSDAPGDNAKRSSFPTQQGQLATAEPPPAPRVPVDQRLTSLPRQEKVIIAYRLGLVGGTARSRQELAELFHAKATSVAQIEREAVTLLSDVLCMSAGMPHILSGTDPRFAPRHTKVVEHLTRAVSESPVSQQLEPPSERRAGLPDAGTAERLQEHRPPTVPRGMARDRLERRIAVLPLRDVAIVQWQCGLIDDRAHPSEEVAAQSALDSKNSGDERRTSRTGWQTAW